MRARDVLIGADGRPRPAWRLAAFAAAVVVALAIAQALIVGPLTTLQGVAGGPFDTTSIVFTVALLAAHHFALRVVERRAWRDVRLDRPAWRPPALGWGTLAGAIAIALPVGALLAVGWLRVAPSPDGSWSATALRLTLFLAPAALWEELAFRGYLFTTLEDMAGRPAALLVTSALFGAAHVTNPGSSLLPLVLVAVAGAFLAGVMLVTGSLAAAWLAHLAFNWMQAVAFHVEVSGSGFATPDYRVIETGPDWATGGPWGPEGGVAALGGMALALLLLNRFTSRRTGRGEITT